MTALENLDVDIETELDELDELDASGWTNICSFDRLTPDRGVAALIDGRAIAVFLLSDGSLHAIDNVDPFSGASILSRGLIGDIGGASTVASPMYKQRFDLATGRCLDSDTVTVAVHQVCVASAAVHVRLGPAG